MPRKPASITRNLYAWEIHEARRVFAGSLAYERVRVHECAAWLDPLDRFGRSLKRLGAATQPNAITLGNHCYFPIRLLENPVEPDALEHYKLSWLIHELTHVLQYQRHGWGAMLRSIHVPVSSWKPGL